MENNDIRKSLNASINDETNPIVIQMKEFGYNAVFSRRLFHYLHPGDLEEALNYLEVVNGIIQHRFIPDSRNNSNNLCYICGEEREIHLIELGKIIDTISD